jgi:TolB-like protein/DNA-binding winged helix-turn-helix (wHTH) protein/Tfp pilus assembly protein PilF
MEPSTPKSPRIAFDRFEVDLRSGELRKNGRRVRLQAQPFQLLVLMLEHPGEVVTREEICRKLWDAETFVDFDHSLGTAINKIREALGDSSEHPQFVETLPRRGYRFICEIKGANGTPSSESGLAPSDANAGDVAGSVDNRIGVGSVAAVQESRRPRSANFVLLLIVSLAVFLATIVFFRRMGDSHAPGPAASIRSIAVLPLENISGDPAQDYFADGMTDELITALAKYKSLRLISRTSVMQYKKARRALPEIARDLGVDGIVEGSVSRSRDRVRVTAQFVYAPTDTHIWAESYDRDLLDVLSLQQELARSIAERVKLASSFSESAVKPVQAPVSAAARDAYFRGRYYWFSERYEQSREFFRDAIRLDPLYAAAYSGLADGYTAASVVGELSSLETMPKAESAATKAVELDDSLAEGHLALAAVKLFYHWDWNGAEREVERAIALNPSLAEAHHLHAYILGTRNHMGEAIQEDKLTVELDPFARPWAYGYALIRARRFDEALKELKQRSQARPDSSILHSFLSSVYSYNGDSTSAIEEMKKAFVIEGNEATAARVDQAYRNGGFRAVNLQFLNSMKRKAAKEYTSRLRMAEVAAGAGHQEEAIHYLEQAFETRDPLLVHLQHDPDLDSLHSDPRYWAIVNKMEMPPFH